MDNTSTVPGIAPSGVTASTSVTGAASAAGTIARPIGPKAGLLAVGGAHRGAVVGALLVEPDRDEPVGRVLGDRPQRLGAHRQLVEPDEPVQTHVERRTLVRLVVVVGDDHPDLDPDRLDHIHPVRRGAGAL